MLRDLFIRCTLTDGTKIEYKGGTYIRRYPDGYCKPYISEEIKLDEEEIGDILKAILNSLNNLTKNR